MSISKYLGQYAEPDIEVLQTFPRGRYDQALVIPACNEPGDFLKRLPVADKSTLLVLVINQSEAAATAVSQNNELLARTVGQLADQLWACGDIALHRTRERPTDILLVDRFSTGREIPVDGGVGQARKIGADAALYLMHRGVVESSWIHNTDADTWLPDDYFAASSRYDSDHAALLYPFTHDSDQPDKVHLTTLMYEFSLRYYEEGLRQAGSPYAFQTVGSAFAVHAEAYAKVRGFPKKAAAEDFYMLNKLAKVGAVTDLETEPIRIESRVSDRVPFGTGAAVSDMVELQDPITEYRFYHPAVFAYLKQWLALLPRLWGSSNQLDDCNDVLRQALDAIGVNKALQHALRQSNDAHQFQKQMHAWFDAFRTLKLIHWLRDQRFPSIPLSELIAMYQSGVHEIVNEPMISGLRRIDRLLPGRITVPDLSA